MSQLFASWLLKIVSVSATLNQVYTLRAATSKILDMAKTNGISLDIGSQTPNNSPDAR